MADITPEDMANKLLAAGFERAGPTADALSDPITDTPMVVTLDDLRPYDHDPRKKRNPAYDEIKASIRERGLDAAPSITRRPGDPHYIIRNGGNTRLAILRELWAETKDERFFRISCLFRPWPARGEVVMLTGHLAENELRASLTFIERALGVEKAREFYEQEAGTSLTQADLARRLAADGFPVQQSHISRMADAVHYLLPAIPTRLYGGLGRHQVERLCVMRNAGERIWLRHARGSALVDGFDECFQDVLVQFDAQGDEFSASRVQDELIGRMSELLRVDYDVLALDMTESEARHRALASDPTPLSTPPALPDPVPDTRPPGAPPPQAVTRASENQDQSTPPSPTIESANPQPPDVISDTASASDTLSQHIVSPAPTSDRVQSIQRMVADQLGEAMPPDFAHAVLQSIPLQADGLYPITDLWYIDPGLDTPQHLRIHIAQFAREIAAEVNLDACIESAKDGIGFICRSPPTNTSDEARTVLWLLACLTCQHPMDIGMDTEGTVAALPGLLHGKGESAHRLSDTSLVKLLRLLRLARRLWDLETGTTGHDT